MIIKQIGIIAFEQVNLLDVSGPAQVFTEANHVISNPSNHYQISVYSPCGGMVSSNCGIKIDSLHLDKAKKGEIDTLIIAGGSGVHHYIDDQDFINSLFSLSNQTPRVASVCTGAFLLARTGLLDNKKAVTHWQQIDQFKSRFPMVNVQENSIYTKQGKLWTSAGITAGIDLSLALVAEELGHEVSIQTARALVVYLKRAGGQAQFSMPLRVQSNDKSGQFEKLHQWVANNLQDALSIDQLAQFMNMSTRNFFRLYKKKLGISPAKNIELMRLEFAQQQLESNSLNINQIANLCGFANEERLRRVFIRHVGVSPSEYRKHFQLLDRQKADS